jgi:hypothetical protein
MEWFLAWLIFSILAGVYADNLGRSGIGWAFLGMILSPLVALIVLLIIGQSEDGMVGNGMKKCPYCAELIRDEAIKCKHCGEAQTRNLQRQAEESELSALIAQVKKQNSNAAKDVISGGEKLK